MCGASSNENLTEPLDVLTQFEQIRAMVESEFNVEEGFVERDIPTFYVKMRKDSKKAFLRLTQRMESLKLIPVLKSREKRIVLLAIPKPSTKPSQNIINIGLLFATLGTVFLSGYLQSSDITGALMFTGLL